MEITEKSLFENGFEKKQDKEGSFYIKGKIGVVQNIKWLPCNVETGELLVTNTYVNTLEELYKYAEEGGAYPYFSALT